MAKLELVDIFKKRTRHPFRPRSSDVINRLFSDFMPFGSYRSDSLIAGSCQYADKLLYVVAQQKPKPENLRSDEDLKKLNYGMLTSDDHSVILSVLKDVCNQDLNNTFLFSIIDTYGADISMYSAQRFQAFFIAHLIREFLTLPIRTISLILGEGGSGGALAIQVTDIRGQMEDALYATAPPESMASIVFRDPERIEDALAILKPGAKDLKNLGVIDRIVPAPEDVTDAAAMSANIDQFLTKAIKDLSRSNVEKLIKRREIRAKRYGVSKGSGTLFDIKRYIETPIKKAFRKPPPNIEIVNYTSLTEVGDDYGNIQHVATNKALIECGAGMQGDKRRKGCGKLIPLKALLDNFNVCPECGFSYNPGGKRVDRLPGRYGKFS